MRKKKLQEYSKRCVFDKIKQQASIDLLETPESPFMITGWFDMDSWEENNGCVLSIVTETYQ